MSQTKYVPKRQIEAYAAKMSKNTRGALLLSLETGVRISDALKVRYRDFDSDGFLHYTAGKTGKKGRAKVSPEFMNEFIGKKRGLDYVFKSPKNPQKPITRQAVFTALKKAVKLCGEDPEFIAPHSARKSFAVDDYRQHGFGRVMHDLQHGNAATTLLYALSDDPIPDIMKDLSCIRKELKFLHEVCDSLCDRVFGDDIIHLKKS